MLARIYSITNRVNGTKYVGKTVMEPLKRWLHHACYSNKNLDWPLYRAMRKYGIENFEFRVIELCDDSEVEVREAYWIAKLETLAPWGYNLRPGGKHITPTRESIQKMRTTLSLLHFTLISPEGVVFSPLWLLDFCRENGLSHDVMRNIAKAHRDRVSKRRYHRGWDCYFAEDYIDIHVSGNGGSVVPDTERSRSAPWIKYRFVVRSPDGRDMTPLASLVNFSKRMGLTYSQMYEAAKDYRGGLTKPHKGWLCCYHDDYSRFRQEVAVA